MVGVRQVGEGALVNRKQSAAPNPHLPSPSGGGVGVGLFVNTQFQIYSIFLSERPV